ncbi:LOW QUALITY PROTEIN: COPII coat complex component secretory 31 [Leptinotarsa decemlineata]|uniref:LOW QUALITY PROTEIN: COPII coat complex component secretory 31 n=1 Tax=Leptinotarsa decemlineata TaxID=7539 RepID=UPI003D30CBBB
MKVKDIERTANVAWSPKSQYPIYIAAGTAAQQLDASFNTNAALEVYSLSLSDPGPDTQLVSSIPSDHRFHKIIWGSCDNEPSGTIVGGCDGGLIQIYSASKLLKGEDAIVGKQEKHTGPVHAMDFNNFQKNLFATGAGDSEIFIWDLNNTSTPMSPGAKSQPHEDVLSVSWNKQVQHILASTYPSKCVIWDLRKNEPIIKLTDTVSRIRWKVVAWHPDVATQLCLASEEDQSPIIQLWDLRFATSPLKTLQDHRRGVLSLSWCSEDPDLLVSCGKDNRILCWNPNSNQQNGEVLAEVARTNQWSFDVVWCPRNPALIASPNFDGHVSIYSLMGGKTQQIQTTNKIADSFPGMEGYVQAPVPQQNTAPVSVDLSKPPRWLKRPVRASFGFGGKLITFENDKEAIAQAFQNVQAGQPPAVIHRTVQISQVITEAELVKKSVELEKALEYGNFTDYCLAKSEDMNDQHKRYIWYFLKANFEDSPRRELLNLLGYSIEDINNKLNQYVTKDEQNIVDGLTNDFDNLNRIENFAATDVSSSTPLQKDTKKTELFKIKTNDDTEGLITQALLMNNVEAAVELCLQAKRFADALIISATGGPDLLARTQLKYLEQTNDYVSSLISAIVSEDWSSIINNCEVSSWKEALAAVLTHATDDDLPVLCELLGKRLEEESKKDPKLSEDAQLCYICAGSFEKLVSSWSENAMQSTSSLQELIELVTFLQKAIERQGRQVQVSGALADLLSHYASLLASQGSLTTAINYLGSSNNEKVASLRDRLYVALGQKPVNVQEVRQQQSRRSSHRQSFSSQITNAFNNTNPFHSAQQQFGQPGQTAVNQAPHFGQNQFNTGLPNSGLNNQPWQTQAVASAVNYTQPPKPFSPAPQVPPPSHPPRPTSVGSSHGGSAGLPSRKYVLDPSVSSNSYGQIANQFPPQPVNSYQNNTFANNSYTQPPIVPSSTPGSQIFNPLLPSNSAVVNPTFNPTPIDPNSTPMMPVQGFGGSSLPPPPTAEIAQPSWNTFSAPSGWNDPPPISRPPKPQAKPDLPVNEPITHPIYGSAPTQPLPINGYENVAPGQPFNPSVHPQNPPTVFQPPVLNNFTSPGFNPGNFNQNAVQSVAQQLQNVSGTVRPEKPQPIEKGPIPEEHIHMKTVFDELRDQCSRTANNPQTRRKLEDVGRKLEALYDSLREYKLSANTLGSLHEMVQLVQNGDYAGGMNLHTQLVSGPDFAQIASFMPGLKVLLQCASQLQVYLR